MGLGVADAKVVIDMAEVGRVVLVHRLGFEDRVEVDRVDAERAEVGQLLAHTREVAAVAALPDVACAVEEVRFAGLVPLKTLRTLKTPSTCINVRSSLFAERALSAGFAPCAAVRIHTRQPESDQCRGRFPASGNLDYCISQ